MKKRKNLSTVPWTPFQQATAIDSLSTRLSNADNKPARIWVNSRYHVLEHAPEAVPGVGRVVWLSLRATDRSARHDWREMQRIKNEIMGPELDAVEIYPAESKLVDGANQYHLWVFLDTSIPFGFKTRVVSDGKFENSRQRPFEERPADCLSGEEFAAAVAPAIAKASGNL